MKDDPSPAAVCVMRIERRKSGLAITVVVNPDIRQTSEERLFRTGDADEAVQLIRDVITVFREDSGS
ncbi:hypothetical protein ACQP2Y_12425 [Actinoplanes sp. CA-051413]|uniref:hypothetical protein n=1 Tax=Actinoplanes sp. CA-051413 TaxID=3239899 RepID=UPI003D95724B